jgi:hypothetical protein
VEGGTNMKNERYIITDGVYFLTGASNFVREPTLALKFTDREAAQRRADHVKHLVGTSFKIKRLNLNTGGVR